MNKMKVKELNTWEEFQNELRELDLSHKRIVEKNPDFKISKPIFRGQGDSDWKLQTTLERRTEKDRFDALAYYEIAEQAQPQIETFTPRKWEVNRDDFEEWAHDVDIFWPGHIPSLEYLIYLRHHGFPSPLLDWTRSPYISAFFSYNHIPKNVDKVSIYVFLEWTGQGKTSDADTSLISSVTANSASHKRHFIQQSEYTICLRKMGTSFDFTSHENAKVQIRDGESLLWKFTLPSSERVKVLKILDQMNINALSLFGSEDSLMETLALREFDFGE